VNAASPHGDTALMAAALRGREAVVELLLQHGANPTLKNKAGATAVDFAAERGHFQIAEMLERRSQPSR
jgi:ankyrin repeat protein